ncbi:ATP-binding domain-containing protein, partial [bacterium]|nr:ATP-binding domain-containing protein [bacterium]
RTNAQSRAFEEALTRRGLPYRLVGGFKFYERKEVKDVLAYLRLYENPKESVSVARCQKLGKRRFAAYQAWREQYQADPDHDDSPGSVIQAILQATKYRELYDDSDPEEVVKLDNIQELLAHASQFESIATFLENVALIQDDYGPEGARAEQTERDEVTLMSLHSAKGLEFEAVFLVGLEENLLPHSRSLMDADQLAEERRLCYVGITRAKRRLFFTCARRRWVFGSVQTSCRSRFLDDLDPDLLEVNRLEEFDDGGERLWRRRGATPRRGHAGRSAVPERTLDTSDSQLTDLLYGDIDLDHLFD